MKVTAGTHADWGLAFGVATASLDMNQYMSSTVNGWAYFCNGTRGHQSASTTDTYGQRINVGDRVGVLYNSDNGSVTFYHNGSNLGVCYNGITSSLSFSPFSFFVVVSCLHSSSRFPWSHES
jgi:hypothetical protein